MAFSTVQSSIVNDDKSINIDDISINLTDKDFEGKQNKTIEQTVKLEASKPEIK